MPFVFSFWKRPANQLEYLLVGGGGGGANGHGGGGGGGAGGFSAGTISNILPGTYAIAIGSGGTGGITSGTIKWAGANGGNTTAQLPITLTAFGGGGGSAGIDGSGQDSQAKWWFWWRSRVYF